MTKAQNAAISWRALANAANAAAFQWDYAASRGGGDADADQRAYQWAVEAARLTDIANLAADVAHAWPGPAPQHLNFHKEAKP